MEIMNASAPPNGYIAVLTGDFIRSTQMSGRDLSHSIKDWEHAVAAFTQHYTDILLTPADFYRGDAWQVALGHPQYALRFALFIRAHLISRKDYAADTRVAIGIGGVDLLDNTSTARSNGEAFVLSGRTLDQNRRDDLSIAMPPLISKAHLWLEGMVHACGITVSAWSSRQADIASRLLLEPELSQAEIGRLVTPQIKQQTVRDSLAASNWALLEKSLQAFEATDWSRIQNHVTL